MRVLLAVMFVLAVDTPDLQRWRSCSTRSGVRQGNESCKPLDLDGDSDVDQDDFGIYHRRAVPAPSSCPPCEPCPCDPAAEHGADIVCVIYRVFPPDLQREWDEFNVQFGKKLATRPY